MDKKKKKKERDMFYHEFVRQFELPLTIRVPQDR